MTPEFKAGYAAAMKRAATIADSHRAMHLNGGRGEAGCACSSVAAFIIEVARDVGCWDESLKQPLVLSESDKEHRA